MVALALPGGALADVNDPNFADEQLHYGNGMTVIEFGPGDLMYVAEKLGVIQLFTPDGTGGYGPPAQFADLSAAVFDDGESGLLGMALDPDFATNRHIFLFYTTEGDQRLVRITANESYTSMVPDSEQVVLSGLPRTVDYHKAGGIEFHPDEPGHIYITIGDDSDIAAAQDLSRYNGKMLRVDKTTGRGVPANPFWDGNADSITSRIWSRGHRNAFRFTFHPETPVADAMYVSENGNSTDRLSFVRMGADGEWNTDGDEGGFLSPSDSRHLVMDTFPPQSSTTGIAIARGGAFADPANPGSDVLIIGNMILGIKRYRLEGTDLDQAVPLDGDGYFATNYGFATGADIRFGPDGALYLTTSATGDSANFGSLWRIRFVAGDAPVAAFTTSPSPASGEAPLVVAFMDGSSDPDGNLASWSWDFGDGTTSEERNPTHTYDAPGTYTARLTVRDDTGLRGTAETEVRVARMVTFDLQADILDGRDRADAPLAAASELRFYQADGTTPLRVTSGTGPDGNVLSITGSLSASLSVELTGDGLVVSAGEPEGDGVHAAFKGVAVAGGSPTTVALTFHLSDTAIRGRVADPRGAPAAVDVGLLLDDAPYAVAGGRDYLADSDLAATSVAHRVVADALGYYYLALESTAAGAFTLDVVADTGADAYGHVEVSGSISAGALVEQDVVVGLLGGGEQCDDLSGVNATSGIDYAAQIQPIWDGACLGCHDQTPSSNGGLNLTGDSESRLVNVASVLAPGVKLVEPGYPERSFLMEKVSCWEPQAGTRMRPMDAMPLQEQGLIRDWILGLSPRDGRPPASPGGSPNPGGGDGGPGSPGGMDAGTPGAMTPDAGLTKNEDGGCGCRAPGGSSRPGPVAGGLLLLAVLALRASRRTAARRR